jgi:hypothetical protein
MFTRFVKVFPVCSGAVLGIGKNIDNPQFLLA